MDVVLSDKDMDYAALRKELDSSCTESIEKERRETSDSDSSSDGLFLERAKCKILERVSKYLESRGQLGLKDAVNELMEPSLALAIDRGVGQIFNDLEKKESLIEELVKRVTEVEQECSDKIRRHEKEIAKRLHHDHSRKQEGEREEFQRMASAYEEQIRVLKHNIQRMEDDLKEVETEKELLKLKNLEKNKRYTGNIQRDKMEYRLKLFEVDMMDANDVRNLLKDACIKAHSTTKNVLQNIDNMVKVMRGVPVLTDFINNLSQMTQKEDPKDIMDQITDWMNNESDFEKRFSKLFGIKEKEEKFKRLNELYVQNEEIVSFVQKIRHRRNIPNLPLSSILNIIEI